MRACIKVIFALGTISIVLYDRDHFSTQRSPNTLYSKAAMSSAASSNESSRGNPLSVSGAMITFSLTRRRTRTTRRVRF